MSFAVDIRFKHYMVELDNGRTVHVGDEDVQGVKEYIASRYNGNKIKTIYLEVFSGDCE
jgi:hypothetical protein